jgi:hypothetical protein
LHVLGIEVNLPAYRNLKVLNLYDNHLSSLEVLLLLYIHDHHQSQGIGFLDQTPIEEINLGCNDLDLLPLEVTALSLYLPLNSV